MEPLSRLEALSRHLREQGSDKHISTLSCTAQTHTHTVEVAGRPRIDVAAAASFASSLYGLAGSVKELGSHQDRNFLIRTPGGAGFVVKIANKSWKREALEAQNAALSHLAKAAPGLIAPRPVLGLDGASLYDVSVDGDTLILRVLSYVEGRVLTGTTYLAPCVVADLGAVSATTSLALSGFDHPGLHVRSSQWDLSLAHEVVTRLSGSMADASRRATLLDVTRHALSVLNSVEPRLRRQAVHGDITDDNVVGERDGAGRVRPRGVIDFGDLTHSWLVSDLAVTCSCVLRYAAPHDFLSLLPAVAAFHSLCPLFDEDVCALWPLIVLRGAMLVVSGQHQAKLDPDNPSVTEPLEGEWRIFSTAASVPFPFAEAAVRAGLGWIPVPPSLPPSLPPHTHTLLALPSPPPLVDLSATSPALHGGRFLSGPSLEQELLCACASSHPSRIAGTVYGQPRLTRSGLEGGGGVAVPPLSHPLGVDVCVGAGTRLYAPWDCDVVTGSDCVRLVSSSGVSLLLSCAGIACPLPALTAGAQVAVLPSPACVWVQLCLDASLQPPRFTDAAGAGGWSALCPDPSSLIGLPPVDAAQAHTSEKVEGEWLARRVSSYAVCQGHYYSTPMLMLRGWRTHLIDRTCRPYLDVVNNVSAVGHGHPRLAAAVGTQLHTLNTNSRFHYPAVAELCERVAATCPYPLDTVLLVNSGSEAVDLALRIAQVVTGRQDIIAVEEGYHGVTYLSDAVTTEDVRGASRRPKWVHLADAPNAYRGKHRGPAAGKAYAAGVAALVSDMVAEGTPPAAFVAEPLFGNGGGVPLPPGYLASVYACVRSAGGMCVCDEVQVGYGRTGEGFWAHTEHGVVPDIITVAKAMGNGHPLGAVITTKAIAHAFGQASYFFSSAGGSPASCVAGIAVLDIIRDEGLQANAASVGELLLARLRALQDKHAIIGAVLGKGLYLGVELVRDRASLEPAAEECVAICDRLRTLGVVCQPASMRGNVLKLKPPMTMTHAQAHFFVDQLDKVLSEGW